MITIEKATIFDINELFELQKVAFESEAVIVGNRNIPALIETMADFESDFINWTTLVIKNIENKIIASARYKISTNDTVIEIGRVMVHPEYRKQGYAKILLEEIENQNQNKTLELYTCAKNVPSISLYKRMGFSPYKTIKDEHALEFIYLRKAS